MNYRDELASLAECLDIDQYYNAWRLALMLWRGLWYQSEIDWSRYRFKVWAMFAERLRLAAKISSDLDMFLSRVSRLLALPTIGTNEDDRAELSRLLALPSAERRNLMRQLREESPVIVALVRRWRDISREEREWERKATFGLYENEKEQKI